MLEGAGAGSERGDWLWDQGFSPCWRKSLGRRGSEVSGWTAHETAHAGGRGRSDSHDHRARYRAWRARFHVVGTSTTPTLYEVLAAPAPAGVAEGETILTLSKETLDADEESSLLEAVLIGG